MTFYTSLEENREALLRRIRKKYRLDYVLITPFMIENVDDEALRADPIFQEVHRTSKVVLYRLPPAR